MSKANSAMAGAAAGAQIAPANPLMGAAIGGVAGLLMGQDDNSNKAYEEMMKRAQSIPLPILKEYYPELYKQVVELNPELDSAVNLGPSEMQGISTDPALRAAQLNALSKLQEVGDAGGMDAQFLAENNKLQNDVNSNLKGKQDAILQDMAVRGMSGGGSELVARQMAAQGASNQQAQSAMDLKAQAQQRALQAIMQGGQLGGQMQSQDFSQQSAKAQAADAIAKFNAQNQQNVRSSNVASKNNAMAVNAANAQSIANQNVGSSNQAKQYNLGLAQQNFNNQLAKNGIVNSVGGAAAANSARQADNQDQFLGSMASSFAKYGAAKQQKPEDEV